MEKYSTCSKTPTSSPNSSCIAAALGSHFNGTWFCMVFSTAPGMAKTRNGCLWAQQQGDTTECVKFILGYVKTLPVVYLKIDVHLPTRRYWRRQSTAIKIQVLGDFPKSLNDHQYFLLVNIKKDVENPHVDPRAIMVCLYLRNASPSCRGFQQDKWKWNSYWCHVHVFDR